MKRFLNTFLLMVCALALAGTVLAQTSTVGSLTGTVSDPTGAVIFGAKVVVLDEATGKIVETQTGADGGFFVGNLQPGSYTVTVTTQGFKKAEVRAVKIVVGGQRGLAIQLELGPVESTVVVEAGSAVLETSETKVGTTIVGRSITQLPFTSRDTIDLALLMPGAATTGTARSTSFLGLPKGAINITLDGINAQDNVLKSADGFFTTIRPRIDSIEEFSISTAGQGAGEAGEGAVQVRMETKRGGNEFHGGAWWYHRNDKFNSNYYFNNLAGTPKTKLRLNQFGVKIGGPIIADRLFFFTALDFYRKPESFSRTRTILTDEASTGLFRWNVNAVPAGPYPANVACTGAVGSAGSCSYNLLAAAAAAGFPGTVDPYIAGLVAAMNSSVGVPGVGLLPNESAFQRTITFNNGGAGRRNFPDFRFDYNLNKNHSITAIYHYNYFTSTPDFLNSFDSTYPVAPFTGNQGSQISNRNQMVAAWRWNIGTNKSNEVRAGLVSAPLSFFPDLNVNLYPGINTNLGPIRVRSFLPGIVSQPLLAWSVQGRNGGIFQLIDTFSWALGRHNLSIGGNWTEVRVVNYFDNGAVGTVQFGIATGDPANTIFASTNFPGLAGAALSTQQGNARSLYTLLTGRVNSFTGNINLDLEARQFATGQRQSFSTRQTEIALYIQDAFRFRPNLTINAGVRWDYQGAPRDLFNMLFRNRGENSDESLAGVSGTAANLFNPSAGFISVVPGYELNGDRPWYNRDLNNFAPNLGFSWQPSFDGGFLRTLVGRSGQTVLRGSYAITFTREGTNNFASIAQSNPGFTSALSATAPAQFPSGSILLRDGLITGVLASPASFVTSFDMNPAVAHGVNIFNENISIPYVQSWTFGIQREITPSTVVEIRYVGNHGTGLWRQNNWNERNIFENGFLQEFMNAKNNLAIFQAANPLCDTSGQPACSFANNGLPGQVALPIMQSMFRSGPGGNFTSQFTDSSRKSQLTNNLPGAFANTLASSFSLWTNMTDPTFAGRFQPNLFILNPHARGGGAWLFTNDTHSTYHGLQIEVRRRMTNGLMYSANYSFSKALTDAFANSSVSGAAYTTLRNKGWDKTYSPFDLRHAFKLHTIYELPFGKNKRWSAGNTAVNHIIGGWELSSIARWQSGRAFLLNGGVSGSLNQNDGGVELIGVTPKQIQDSLAIRKLADGKIFWFPEDLVNSATGTANFNRMAPCQNAGELCQKLVLFGPQFLRFDISVVKRTWLTEKINLEYRAEFLNAFNRPNFFFAGAATALAGTAAPPSTSLTATNFGRILAAYQDVSTTDDPGGRIIQMVLRLNF